MNPSPITLVSIIKKYEAPLHRYARFIVKDCSTASALVKEIFQVVFDENGLAKPEDELRAQLINYTRKASLHWLRMKDLHKNLND